MNQFVFVSLCIGFVVYSAEYVTCHVIRNTDDAVDVNGTGPRAAKPETAARLDSNSSATGADGDDVNSRRTRAAEPETDSNDLPYNFFSSDSTGGYQPKCMRKCKPPRKLDHSACKCRLPNGNQWI